MAATERLICASADLVDGRRGVRFEIGSDKGPVGAFVVRYDERVYAYVNRCPHQLTELDWLPGEFFESSGLYLICATHAALFSPEDGKCIEGPCLGRGLQPLPVVERDGEVYCLIQSQD